MQKGILCSLPVLAAAAASSSALEGAGECWRRELSSLTQSTSAAHALTKCMGHVSGGS